ncbi:MAG: NAD-dependent epimerase/dehydratase family protein [Gemmatimonadetes bacterium]|nr:NAD-dependent epimerase/dehydratase family protein [Gemmatimonadota bacterium]
MNVLLFGATGMIGSGALIECLEHPDVRKVITVGRRPSGSTHAKLDDVVHDDFLDYSSVVQRFEDYDACLFCLGVSAAGMSEEQYRLITRDFTLAAADALWSVRPDASFCYISAAGADPEQKSRMMWARVRGGLEQELLERGDAPTWIFRPGYIQPAKGVTSRTTLYNLAYAVAGPLFPLLDRVAADHVTTTERLGLALIRAARDGAHSTHLDNKDINALAEAEDIRKGLT